MVDRRDQATIHGERSGRCDSGSGRPSGSTAAVRRIYVHRTVRDVRGVRSFRTPPRLTDVDYRERRTYVITFCVHKRHPVFMNPKLAEIACAAFRRYCDSGWYWLYAYVVMPDHVHLVVRVRDRGVHLSRIVGMLKSAILTTARHAAYGFRWQRGYHERIIHSDAECEATIQYVLDNPQRKNLVRANERYAFVGVVQSWR